MNVLIERGHVYIAQPPLYKVKKGKQERYLKDDSALDDYLMQVALENAQLYVSADAPPLADVALESLVKQYNATQNIVNRLAKRYDRDLVEKLIFMPAVEVATISQEWIEELEGRLNAELNVSNRFKLALTPASDTDPAGILISRFVHGISTETLLPLDIFAGSEYKKLVDLGEKLDGLLGEGAYVKRGEKTLEVSSFAQALTWLTDEAKRGQHIQRYKGLGEMNPEQLWETTMNQDARRLLKVNIEDAVGADEIFTTLMGDQVEPRREFIETNALTAENIDI